MQEDAPAASEISPKQNNLNIYFMKELKKLKGDQKRLDDEVLHLKLENSNLSARLKTSQWQVMRLMDYFSQMADQQPVPAFPTHAMETTASSTHNPSHIGVSTALPKGRAEQPMVVYDLSKSTATVLTANTTFCQMIGYELNEVIGMPWTEFIPPEAARRTMNTILQQKTLSSTIQLDQVYRHRTGGLFATYDTHTILFGNDGLPISDVVTLYFPESNAAGGVPNTPTFLPPMKFLSSTAANEGRAHPGTHLSPSSIQPLSSPVVESPSDDEFDSDPMLSSPHINRPQSAPVFGHQAKPGAGPRNGKGGRSLTPQATTKKTRRPTTKVTGEASQPQLMFYGSQGEEKAARKLRDNIPKASMRVLDEDEDDGESPHVQHTSFDEVLSSPQRRLPQPVAEGPTSIFQMPPSSNFPSLSSPFPSAAPPFPPSPNNAFTSSASPLAFSFDDTPMASSSSTTAATQQPALSSYGASASTAPHYIVGPNVIPLTGATMPPSSASSATDIAGVEDAFNDLDLDPSFMPFALDEDFLNSLMATHQHNSGGGASSNDNGPDNV
ncbi:uncharacterized protein ACA1_360970 [Acanthamoeba castellanii str. Neff]|uniref:PAS domain-containing protein n=1 Tax=Acanthamoeba castellanii (strain ATCC 30010 / Neff) TaxID=1257118 RepID=L8HF73_ACACF|nr:uncharacterized protein ACA1_360970 [Acanthamoeba castellanii str. Neff]ELR23061.1 hypothetical protein ACA1_360970 [Acanthamoeba castellanii str. Neff]